MCLSRLIYTVRPCLIHTSMPRPCHPRPCPFSQGHGTARPSRAGVWATCSRSASSGYHAEFHEALIRRIPISDAGGQCETKHRLSSTRKRVVAAHYKKRLSQTSNSDISGPYGHSRRTRHCRSTAGARHAMCESALKGLFYLYLCCYLFSFLGLFHCVVLCTVCV